MSEDAKGYGIPKSARSTREAVARWPSERLEHAILLAEQHLLLLRHSKDANLVAAAANLIAIYDSPFCYNTDLRQRAARIVAALAVLIPSVLELVIDNAHHYAETQHIDDAFPYNPNSFDVLANMRPTTNRAFRFLRHMAETEVGVPKKAATEALAAYRDPESKDAKHIAA